MRSNRKHRLKAVHRILVSSAEAECFQGFKAGRKLQLKARFESGSSLFSFKR